MNFQYPSASGHASRTIQKTPSAAVDSSMVLLPCNQHGKDCPQECQNSRSTNNCPCTLQHQSQGDDKSVQSPFGRAVVKASRQIRSPINQVHSEPRWRPVTLFVIGHFGFICGCCLVCPGGDSVANDPAAGIDIPEGSAESSMSSVVTCSLKVNSFDRAERINQYESLVIALKFVNV